MKLLLHTITVIFIGLIAYAKAELPNWRNETLFTAASSSVSFSATSTPIRHDKWAVYCSWTEEVAPLAATVKLQTSTDNINWDDLPGASTSASGTGSALFNITDIHSFYFREDISFVSGTATFTCKLNAKPQ